MDVDLVARYNYGPYGRITTLANDGSGTEAAFGFTGFLKHDTSGLNLTLYRAYDPELGRWISRDPIGENGGLNLYRYSSNNPIFFLDLLGLDDGCNGGREIFLGIDIDLGFLATFELSFGVTINIDDIMESGVYVGVGGGFGATLGAGVVAGYAPNGVSGDTLNGDINIGPVSVTVAGDGEAVKDHSFDFSNGTLGVGEGAGASVTGTKTGKYTISDLESDIVGAYNGFFGDE